MYRGLRSMLLESKIKSISRHLFVAVLFLLIGAFSANAQKKISGLVTDNQDQPLLGVNVMVKGTSKITITDFDGNYIIMAKKGQEIEFSSMGYETKTIKVQESGTINVVMESNVSELDEVVVVGYGTQKKKEVTGAVVQVKAEVLEQTTTSDVGQAIQGQIAGVNVASSSGAPGEEANIVIRGFSSLIDGNNSPLYVVDGIPFDSDPQLSISEIETIDVLKDAASSSIYGVRGSNGVILITTKQGKVGEMNIRVNSEYGVQKIQSDFYVMDKEQYNYLHLLRGALNTDKPQGGVDGDIHRNSSYFTNNTDLSDVLLNDLASIENHSINVSGGKKDLTYSLNVNYFGQEGIFFNSDYNRLNVRSNTKFTKGKWKITAGLTFRRDERQVAPNGMMNRILQYRTFQPSINLNEAEIRGLSEISTDDPNDDWKLNEARRLANVARNLKIDDNRRQNSHTGNIQLDYDVTKGLKLTGRFGVTYTDRKDIRLTPNFSIYNTEGELITNPSAVSVNRTTSSTYSKATAEVFATFTKEIGRHNINLMAATTFEKSTNERYLVEVRNNFNPAITVLDNYELIWNVESGGQDYVRVVQGNLARLQYNYDGKYLLSASARYDGSSQFSEGNRWELFPSISLGWNISDEPFWDSLKSVANSFKMRYSFGSNGNDRFAPYSNQSVITPSIDYVFGSNNPSGDLNSPSSESVALGATQLRYANENLKWETNIEQNLGFDLALFKNKLTITTDIYKNEKRDLLYQVVNPPSAGVSGANRNTVFNVGNMENKGFEVAAKYRHNSKKGVSWNVSGTFTKNKNKVTKTSPNNPFIYLDRSFISDAGTRELVSVITEGREAAAFYLRQTNGLVTDADLNVRDESGNIIGDGDYKILDPSARLGELKYIDQNGDGVLNDDDRVYSGSGNPDFEAGLNFSARYKGFDLSMQLYGAFGGKVMNGNKAYAYQAGVHRDLFYSWTEHNQESVIPWYNGNNTRSYRGGSTYFLEDGDFIRLRNVALGYTIPKKTVEKMGLSKLRLYVQAQNILTLTDYTGFDPEVGGNGLSTRGIDSGKYPLSSQMKMGLQLQF
ncbi:SusC/RagA family TonB-linked outer membrane protein [Wenyingzhuangia sp. IMCC45574]